MTLILGGSGQLGTAFRRLLPDAMAPTRDELDLSDLGAIRRRVTALGPSRIINCAAYTAVDDAEADEDSANLINRDAVGELAAVAGELAIPFTTFSTDYVFDGPGDYTESSTPRPLNAYGRSKLAGEELALRYESTLVVRTSWLISATHPNFVATILRSASTRAVDVVDDQWGRPTLADDLAGATLAAAKAEVTGVIHLASPPATTWFELARTACGLAGLPVERVTPCTTQDLDLAARRPERAVLVSERGLSLPDWREGLPDVVRALLRSG